MSIFKHLGQEVRIESKIVFYAPDLMHYGPAQVLDSSMADGYDPTAPVKTITIRS